MHGVGSRNKLTPFHARLYEGTGMLDTLARALCTVKCLPRKELHEAWEMATVVRGAFRGGRVVDLCSGQGLLAAVMLLLDDTSAEAVAVDVKLPLNYKKVHAAVADAFPAIRSRVQFVQAPLKDFALTSDDLVVSSHACGSLTDDVLAHASAAGARVAVLPCCHEYRFRADLAGSADPALAVDMERVLTLRERGYQVSTPSIPAAVSPKNRLLVGARVSP